MNQTFWHTPSLSEAWPSSSSTFELENLTSMPKNTILHTAQHTNLQAFKKQMEQALYFESKTKELQHSIDNLHKECKEEGFEVFSNQAKNNAHTIIDFICEHFSQYHYDVYPTQDREIAIDCTPQKRRGVLILCDSDGGCAYFSTWDGQNTSFRCSSMDDFSYEALRKIFERFNPLRDDSQSASTTEDLSDLDFIRRFQDAIQIGTIVSS